MRRKEKGLDEMEEVQEMKRRKVGMEEVRRKGGDYRRQRGEKRG